MIDADEQRSAGLLKRGLRHSNDGIRRFIDFAGQIICDNMHDCYAVFFKPRVAANIALGTVAHVMACTVDLDREPRLRAIEIKHVWADRMLTTKYGLSWRAHTQAIP
jgi:hypothetical protein